MGDGVCPDNRYAEYVVLERCEHHDQQVPGMIRFDIYKADQLAATLIYGDAPCYFGPEGEECATLLASTPMIYNLWTGECATEPYSERADWWVARIISTPLVRAGFTLRPH